MTAQKETTSSILIIGAGLAGLYCALKLAPTPVTLISAAPLGKGASSNWAQGGIAAAVGEGDSIEAHIADTIEAGDGLVDPDIARAILSAAPEAICDLLELGVPFDKGLKGRLQLSREAAHSAKRIVRVSGDKAGAAIMQAVLAKVRTTPSISLLEGYRAERLETKAKQITGLNASKITDQVNEQPEQIFIQSEAVILATGGASALYAVTTNPEFSNGEGMAMAALAGAEIAEAEFVQFHPTALDVGLDPAPLATEALRGHGARLVNDLGQHFMQSSHPAAELAPRDHVSRAVFDQITQGRQTYLDCREAIGTRFAQDFPTVHAHAKRAGIDPATQLLPIAPAAHYHMGGVATDETGRTSLAGLWAIGEVASTGLHGGNRLASNSLLEAVVMADKAARDVKVKLANRKIKKPRMTTTPSQNSATPSRVSRKFRQRLRSLMARWVGVERSAQGLEKAMAQIVELERKSKRLNAMDPSWENQLLAAKFICAAAWLRCESRGGHWRTDQPEICESQALRRTLTINQIEQIEKQMLKRSPLNSERASSGKKSGRAPRQDFETRTRYKKRMTLQL